MHRIMRGFLAGALALSTAAAVSPGYATPFQHSSFAGPEIAGSGVIEVQLQQRNRTNAGGGFYRGRHYGGHHYGGRHYGGRGRYHGGRYYGHRGGYYRHGYYNNGGSFVGPAVGFIAGAIVGNAIANGGRHNGSAHVRWCYDHYRSYRASDDTYQPYHGPRRYCRGSY